jgi:IS5 family transposase
MKAHIGVDAKSGLTHSLETTSANEHDLSQVGHLLYGRKRFFSLTQDIRGQKTVKNWLM